MKNFAGVIVILVLLLVVTAVAAFQSNEPVSVRCTNIYGTSEDGVNEALIVLSQDIDRNGEIVCRYKYERFYDLPEQKR